MTCADSTITLFAIVFDIFILILDICFYGNWFNLDIQCFILRVNRRRESLVYRTDLAWMPVVEGV